MNSSSSARDSGASTARIQAGARSQLMTIGPPSLFPALCRASRARAMQKRSAPGSTGESRSGRRRSTRRKGRRLSSGSAEDTFPRSLAEAPSTRCNRRSLRGGWEERASWGRARASLSPGTEWTITSSSARSGSSWASIASVVLRSLASSGSSAREVRAASRMTWTITRVSAGAAAEQRGTEASTLGADGQGTDTSGIVGAARSSTPPRSAARDDREYRRPQRGIAPIRERTIDPGGVRPSSARCTRSRPGSRAPRSLRWNHRERGGLRRELQLSARGPWCR